MFGLTKARANYLACADSAAPSDGALPSAGILDRIAQSVTGVFAVCLGLAVLVRYNGLFVSVIDWDVSLYAVMADQWLQGGLPYQTVWDQHSVGLPALFAAILYVFPKSLVVLHVSACVAVAIAATAIFFIARRLDRSYVAPLAAVALYIAWTARLWGLSGNTEIYINALVASAMLLLLREAEKPSRGPRSIAYLCLGALLLGVALQVKHVAVAETALFFAVAAALACRGGWAHGARALAALIGSFLLPSLIVVGYFVLEGLGSQYFEAVIDANLVYVIDRPSLGEVLPYVPRSFILPIGAVVAALATAWRGTDRRTALVLAWAIAAFIDVALPGKFWLHYFLLIMAPAALLAGRLAAGVHRALRGAWGRPSLVAAAVAILVLLGCNPAGAYRDSMKVRAFGHRDVPAIVADVIADELVPGETIFVFNYQPIIYFLTGARLPTRHVFPADWARSYTAVSGVDPLAELDSVFATRPQYVVFVDTDWMKIGEDVLAALHRHLSLYEKQFEMVDVQILPRPVMVQVYRRRFDASIANKP